MLKIDTTPKIDKRKTLQAPRVIKRLRSLDELDEIKRKRARKSKPDTVS